MSAESRSRQPDPALADRTASDIAMLETIAAVGPATSPQLADAFSTRSRFAAGTASNALDRLRADSLIETKANIRNPNAPLWTLTERGDQLLDGGDRDV
jgi:hypothetical protein